MANKPTYYLQDKDDFSAVWAYFEIENKILEIHIKIPFFLHIQHHIAYAMDSY